MPDPFTAQIASAEDAILARDGRLVDVIDALLAQGVVLRGEAWITVADVELVFLGLDLVLANPDTMSRERSHP